MSNPLTGLLPPVLVEFTGNVQDLAAKAAQAQGIINVFKSDVETNWKEAGTAALGIGAALTAASGGIMVESLKAADEFNNQMDLIHLQAGASIQEVEDMKQKVLDLSEATGVSTDQLTTALYHIESQGYRAEDAYKVMAQAANLSMISGADAGEVAKGLTATIKSFGGTADDASHYAALFNSIVGAGDMTMTDFSAALGTGFFDAAHTFGISAESAGAALAFMTGHGQGAEEAATRLRMSIALMSAPTTKATQILGALGLTTTETMKAQSDAGGVMKTAGVTYSQLAADLQKPDGFVVALSHLRDGLEKSGLSAEASNALLAHAFGGGKSDSTILAMLQNLDDLKGKYQAVTQGVQNYSQDTADAQDKFGTKVNQLNAAVHDLGIAIGEYLMPYALDFVNWLKTAIDWMKNNQDKVKDIAIALGVTLAGGIALVIAGFIALAAATVEIWGPILLIVVAVMAVVAAAIYLWTHWSQIWDWIKGKAQEFIAWIVGWFVDRWNDLLGFLSDIWDAIVSRVVGTWDMIRDFFAKWWPLLLAIFLPFIAILVAIWNHFHDSIKSVVLGTWNWISSTLSGIWNWIVGTARTIWDDIYNAILQPIISVAEDVGGWLWAVANTVQNVFWSVLNWLGGLWWDFYNFGWNMIQGIINGVWDAASGLFNALQNIAENALQYAKDFLGIASPSRVFAEQVGAQIPAGIAQGVTANMGVLHTALAGIAGLTGVVGPLDVGVSQYAATTLSSTSTGVLNLNIVSVGQVDGQTLFTTTQQKSLRYQRRNGIPAFSS